MTWTELSDSYFQWWQSAATRYMEMFKQTPFFLQGLGFSMERSLEFKKMADQLADEMWRNFRLPSLEEITRLHERINLLESRLVDLQERDWAQEVSANILEKSNLATRDDFKPLKKGLANLEKKSVGSPELERVKEAVTQVETKVTDLAGELAEIKETLALLDPKLTALAETCEKLSIGTTGGPVSTPHRK